MDTNIKQLKCGECGGELHRLYLNPKGEVIAECIECDNQSLIKMTEPKIVIEHKSGSGRLCVFD